MTMNDVVELALREAKGNESVFETLERLILFDAWEEHKELRAAQLRIAALLRVTPRVVNYKLRVYGLRPADQQPQEAA